MRISDWSSDVCSSDLVYAEGTRHKLTLLIKPADAGRTSVSVVREVFREERILWMKERKPLPTTDRSVELAVLAAIESSLPPPAVAPRQIGRATWRERV